MSSRINKEKTQKSISPFLSTGEVANIFSVHPNTIRRWCQKGKMCVERTGVRGDRKYRRDEVAIHLLDRAIKMFLKGKS